MLNKRLLQLLLQFPARRPSTPRPRAPPPERGLLRFPGTRRVSAASRVGWGESTSRPGFPSGDGTPSGAGSSGPRGPLGRARGREERPRRTRRRRRSAAPGGGSAELSPETGPAVASGGGPAGGGDPRGGESRGCLRQLLARDRPTRPASSAAPRPPQPPGSRRWCAPPGPPPPGRPELPPRAGGRGFPQPRAAERRSR